MVAKTIFEGAQLRCRTVLGAVAAGAFSTPQRGGTCRHAMRSAFGIAWVAGANTDCDTRRLWHRAHDTGGCGFCGGDGCIAVDETEAAGLS